MYTYILSNIYSNVYTHTLLSGRVEQCLWCVCAYRNTNKNKKNAGRIRAVSVGCWR